MYPITIFIAFLLIGGIAAEAQSGPIAGPKMGMVLDANSRLRPVLGVPGAAYLEPPLSIEAGLQVAAISPRHDYVLARRGDASDLLLLRDPLSSAGTSTVLVGGAGAGRVILSRTGSAALVLEAAGSSFRVVSGLPEAPAIAWQSDLSAIAGITSSIAVSDDGKAVLVAAGADDRASIYLVTADGGPRMVATAGLLRGLAFFPGRPDVLIGDAALNQVQIIRDIAGSASLAIIAGIAGLVDIAGSEDGAVLYVASTNPSGVIMVDARTGSRQSIACECTPSGLFPLTGNGVFRLTDPAGGDLWVFDGGTLKPRTVLVPTSSTESAQ